MRPEEAVVLNSKKCLQCQLGCEVNTAAGVPDAGNSTIVSAGADSTRSVTSRAGCTPLLLPSPNSAVMLLLPLPLLLLLRVGLLTGLPLWLSMLLSGGVTQSYARTCNVPYSNLQEHSTGMGKAMSAVMH